MFLMLLVFPCFFLDFDRKMLDFDEEIRILARPRPGSGRTGWPAGEGQNLKNALTPRLFGVERADGTCGS